MIELGFLISLIILIISWLLFKNFTQPPFILSLIWCVIYLVEIMVAFNIDNNDIKYCIFAIGAAVFLMGYYLSNKIIINNKYYQVKNYENTSVIYVFNGRIKLITIINSVLVTIVVVKVLIHIYTNYNTNIWKSIVNYNKNIFDIYYAPFAHAISLVCIISCFNNKKNMKYAIINLFPSLFLALISGNRSNIVMVIIADSFAVINSKKINNIKLTKKIIKIFLVVLFIFLFIGRFKYTNMKDVSNIIYFKTMLKMYIASPMVAFIKWMNQGIDYLYGQNTFRFIIALFGKLGFRVEPQPTVQKFLYFDDIATNVYTIYHYYVKDFGVFYAYIIEFLLGMLYGNIFKKIKFKKVNNLYYRCVSCYLYYPLIMQFYADAYFAYLSFWIQMVIWLYLFTRKWLITDYNKEGK